jgi:hypothetical protein
MSAPHLDPKRHSKFIQDIIDKQNEIKSAEEELELQCLRIGFPKVAENIRPGLEQHRAELDTMLN